jgi:transposase
VLDYQQLYEQELASKTELVAMVNQWKRAYDELYVHHQQTSEQNEARLKMLAFEMEQLKKLIYGSRSERFATTEQNSAQLSLGMQSEQVHASSVTGAQKISYTRKGKQGVKPDIHPVRTKLPDHLPRVQVILEPEDKPLGAISIREEKTEELDFQPGHFFVRQYIRPVYVQEETFIIADLPSRPLPKAIAGAGLLAQIVIDKYVDHLPLHRQQQRFSRDGLNIPYSTITDWVGSTCTLITPLYEALKKKVLHSPYLHADETPLKVLDKDKKGSTHRGYYWVYHNSLDDLVFFDYQQGRGREGPQQILEGYSGYLQTDGYSVYNIIEEKTDVTLLHCWAHARRKFHESVQSDPEQAQHVLSLIGKLYAIERQAKEENLSADQIKERRERKSIPVLDELKEWMTQAYMNAKPKSPIGKALAYCLERWDKLVIYTTDGRLNIDNNPVENSIRPVALGRKNYLFAGSHEAAQRSAMLYSLLGTCKLHGINPFEWLRDTLQKINDYPINRIHELLPIQSQQ